MKQAAHCIAFLTLTLGAAFGQADLLVGTASLTITNPAPAVGDAFGFPVVTVPPDKLLVGAYLDDAGAVDAGSAYLFSTNGTLLATFTNPVPQLRDYFGFRLAAVGSAAVVISAYESGPGTTGAAWLFSTNGSPITGFNNPVPWSGDRFGVAVVGMGADRVLIGATSHDEGDTVPGAAFLFSTNGTLLTAFTNPSPHDFDGFGQTLAVIGNHILIGAPQDDTGALDSGIAYLFDTNGLLVNTFTNPAPGHSDYFGASIAPLSFGMFAIGAHSADNGATEAGVAYVYNTNGTLISTITNPSPGIYDHFASAVVAVDAERLLISAPSDARLGPVDGTVYLCNTNGESLAALAAPPGVSRGAFGASAAVLGANRFAISSHQDDTGAENAGAVHIFDLSLTSAPGIEIERNGPVNVRLSWPETAASFRLDRASTTVPIPGFTQWLEETAWLPTNINGRITVTLPGSDPSYFRLRYP